MAVLLRGFGFTGYRSFVGEVSAFSPLSDINFLAGRNNSGKSNVLRFLADILGKKTLRLPAGLDAPRGLVHDGSFVVSLRVPIDELLRSAPFNNPRLPGYVDRLMRQMLQHDAFRPDGDLIWIDHSIVNEAGTVNYPQASAMGNAFATEAYQLTMDLGGAAYESDAAANISTLLTHFKVMQRVPQVLEIVPVREVRAMRSDDDPKVLDGRGLVQRLNTLQHPQVEHAQDRLKFDEINRLLKRFFADDTFSIEVPHSLDTLNVTYQGTSLPLERHGQGTQQLIILAATVLLHERSLFLIEEPEVNLHPLMLRKLARYLKEYTNNQYIISTHSAHLLDYNEAAVIHVRQAANGSVARTVKTYHESYEICEDLGYRASDLLQANAIIWVEGLVIEFT